MSFNKFNDIKAVNQERQKLYSKRRLINILEKKFKTCYIGALAKFEETFGHLWGHGQTEDLTPEQQEWKELWYDVRTAILNNGNNQARAAMDEISQYTMTWDKYKVEFLVKKEQKEQKEQQQNNNQQYNK